ncbi:MAG: caspase domain-containing protein [Gammaproteobacteria bacterium]
MALVIGNSAYKGAPLKNPVNDARAMAKALAGTGFEVLLVEDAGRAGMHRAIRDFGDSLLRGGVGLFYYAGHGMQVRNRNYLVPVDVEIEREDEVEFQAVDANLVLSKMDSARNSANFVILDACRNNPFQRSFKLASTGLAQMDAAAGTLIAFATAPGQVAADGEGENGLYTSHLLKALRQPGLPVEQMFKQVRNGVMADTKERQVPWESSSLRGDFFFQPADPAAGAAIQQAAIDRAVTDAVKQAEARAAKEREALQAQMRKLIADMLAKQRADLEAELKARGAGQAAAAPAAPIAAATPAAAPASVPAPVAAASTPAPVATKAASASAPPAPAPVPKPAPVQVASIAAAPPGGMRQFAPKDGDQWVYQTRTSSAPGKTMRVQNEVKAVLDDAVLERRVSQISGQREWVFKPSMEISGFGNPSAYNLSPYILAFEDVKVGDSWRDIPFQNLGNCSTHPQWSCRFHATAVAIESVTVPAGTFEAIRVEVEQIIIPNGPGVERKAIYWYAPQVKRSVKAEWRTVSGQWNGPDVQSELVSYKLN